MTLLLCWLVGVPLRSGVSAAVWVSAGALVVWELAAGWCARLAPAQLLGNAVVGGLLAGLLVAVKFTLH